MQHSQKLSYLLRLLWNSSIFGDSYPRTVYENKTIRQIEEIYACFLVKFRPILAEGMPQSTITELNEIIGQIAPKSVAFCAAISAGEIEDTERLCDAAMAIAITYWADQSMDRGDEATLAAIRHINLEMTNGGARAHSLPAQVGARLSTLRKIEHLAGMINEHSEDLPHILRAIYIDSLRNQARMRELSRHHFTGGENCDFWENYAEETALTSLKASGMMSSIALVYSVYRRAYPGIPSLANIYEEDELVRLIDGPFNGAIRVFDDFGDHQVDMGLDTQWGVFNLNLFNQPNAKFLSSFIQYSSVDDSKTRGVLMESFSHTGISGRIQAAKTYIGLLREVFRNLPKPLWERYAVFLSLCKRTLEAGLVNIIGDMLLTDDRGIHIVEPEIMQLLTGYVKTGNLVSTGASKP